MDHKNSAVQLTEKAEQSNLKFVLQKLIDSLGITPRDFSKAIKMPYATLHQLLNDDNIVPKISTLRPISRYFGITIDQLIGDAPLNSKDDEKSIDFSQEQANNVIWNPDLFIECINEISKLLKASKKTIGTNVALLKSYTHILLLRV